MTCPECELLDQRRLEANLKRSRLENQVLSAGLHMNPDLADEYCKVLSECDVLFTAYRAHQKLRHGVTVHYGNALSGGEL